MEVTYSAHDALEVHHRCPNIRGQRPPLARASSLGSSGWVAPATSLTPRPHLASEWNLHPPFTFSSCTAAHCRRAPRDVARRSLRWKLLPRSPVGLAGTDT